MNFSTEYLNEIFYLSDKCLDREKFIMKIMSFLLAILFLISSCADLSLDRTPANIASITDEDIARVFEFEKSDIVGQENYAEKLLQFVESTQLFKGTYSSGNEIIIEFIEDSSLPSNIAYYPEFSVKDNKYTISILRSK